MGSGNPVRFHREQRRAGMDAARLGAGARVGRDAVIPLAAIADRLARDLGWSADAATLAVSEWVRERGMVWSIGWGSLRGLSDQQASACCAALAAEHAARNRADLAAMYAPSTEAPTAYRPPSAAEHLGLMGGVRSEE